MEAEEIRNPKTLVLHPFDRSTTFLNPIWEGKGFDVLQEGKFSNEMMGSYERIVMMGHGWHEGLLAIGKYTFDDDTPPEANEKPQNPPPKPPFKNPPQYRPKIKGWSETEGFFEEKKKQNRYEIEKSIDSLSDKEL